jgi:hypothetical protein
MLTASKRAAPGRRKPRGVSTEKTGQFADRSGGLSRYANAETVHALTTDCPAREFPPAVWRLVRLPPLSFSYDSRVDSTGRGIGTIAGVSGVSTGNGGVGVIGQANNGSNAVGVFGTSASALGQGVHGESPAATGYGVYARNPSGMALAVDGNAVQIRDKGGLVKSTIYVKDDGTVFRCFNSQMPDGGASLPPSGKTGCGFSVKTPYGYGYINDPYSVTFPFQVGDRFVSVTPHLPIAGVNISAMVELHSMSIDVTTFTELGEFRSGNGPFTLIVY